MIFTPLIKVPIGPMRRFQKELCKKIELDKGIFVLSNYYPEEIFNRINNLHQIIPAVRYVSDIEKPNLNLKIQEGFLKDKNNKNFDTFQKNKKKGIPEGETFLIVMDCNNKIYSCHKTQHDLCFWKKIMFCFGNTIQKKRWVWFEQEDNLVHVYGYAGEKNEVFYKNSFYKKYKFEKIFKYKTSDLLIYKEHIVKKHTKKEKTAEIEIKHSSISGGVPVLFAGEICCQNGRPLLLNNISGHYKTPLKFLDYFVEYLQTMKVDMKECEIKIKKSNDA